MSALLVSASGPALTDGELTSVVASLPISLTLTGDSAADLVAVDGAAGWPQRVRQACRDGALGVVLINPEPVEPALVPDPSGVPVVVDHRFAGNPALAGEEGILSGWGKDVLIEVATTVPAAADLASTLVDQLAVLHRLGQPADRLQLLTWDDGGSYLRGTTAYGLRFLISAHVTRGRARSARVRALAADRAVDLTLPDPATARPARLVSTTSGGAALAPTLWETSHRAAWRRLHTAVTAGAPTEELSVLTAHLSLATTALPPS